MSSKTHTHFIHTHIHIQRDIAYERLSCKFITVYWRTCWHYWDFNLSASFGRCLITKFEFICIEMDLVCELFLAQRAFICMDDSGCTDWASYNFSELCFYDTLHYIHINLFVCELVCRWSLSVAELWKNTQLWLFTQR